MDVGDLMPTNRAALLRRLRVAMEQPDEVEPEAVAVFLLLTARYPHAAADDGGAGEPLGDASLRRLYRAMYDADALLALLRARPDNLDEGTQTKFVTDVVDNALPACVAPAYTARLLRAYMEDVLDVRVAPALFRAYLRVCGQESASSLTETAAASQMAHQVVIVCFDVPQPLAVAYRTHYGSVAETIWPASYMLCELLMRNRLVHVRGRRGEHAKTKNKTSPSVSHTDRARTAVLELGSGVGLVGIVCALAGASAVRMTDHSHDGLALIASNVQRNAHALPPGVACTATALDWTDTNTNTDANADPVDVLLMADCWYPQVEGVRHAQAALVRRTLVANAGCEAFCAVALRWPPTVALFEAAYRDAGLRVDAMADCAAAEPLAQRLFPYASPYAMALYRIGVV